MGPVLSHYGFQVLQALSSAVSDNVSRTMSRDIHRAMGPQLLSHVLSLRLEVPKAGSSLEHSEVVLHSDAVGNVLERAFTLVLPLLFDIILHSWAIIDSWLITPAIMGAYLYFKHLVNSRISASERKLARLKMREARIVRQSFNNRITVRTCDAIHRETHQLDRAIQLRHQAEQSYQMEMAVTKLILACFPCTIKVFVSTLAMWSEQFSKLNMLHWRWQPFVDSLGCLIYWPHWFKSDIVWIEQQKILSGFTESVTNKPGGDDFKGGPLVFENVCFAYNEIQKHVFDGTSFTIQPGLVYALHGPNGSGKSTIWKLVLRLVYPQRGMIRIGQSDILDLSYSSLSANIGLVTSDVELFDGTIAYNLKYYHPDASDTVMQSLCKDIGIDEKIISLSKGYDAEMQPPAQVPLSSGERQKLAIVRALIKNPEILFIDEATNALDRAAAQTFQRLIRENRRGKTTIVISHDPFWLDFADRILDIKDWI